MAAIAQLTAEGAVRVAHDEQRAAEVSAALGGKLLRQRVERIRPVVAGGAGIAGEAAVGIAQQIVHMALAARPVVEVQEISERVGLQLIAGM